MTQVPPPPPLSDQPEQALSSGRTGDAERRPWQALLLTTLYAINTVLLVIAGLSGTTKTTVLPDGSTVLVEYSISVLPLILSILSLAITIGLWFRKNAAWAAAVIVCAVSLVMGGFQIARLVVLVPLLVLLFLPVTRSWYKPTHGRDQLSVSKRSVGKLLLVTLGVIVGIPTLLVIVAMLMGG